MAVIEKAYLLKVMGKLQNLEVGQLKYILKDSLTDDEFAQLQTASDIVKILMKKTFVDNNLENPERKTERKKLKKALKIIMRKDLAADVSAIDICPMKGLTKGNRSHLGYGWVNYNRSKNELSIIAKKIFAYQFKRECLEIKDGAGTETILEYPQWEERCKSLFNTFFSRGTSSGIILFPDIEIPFHSQICQAEIWQRLMITLNNWCRKSNPKDATGLIIRNYDLKDHLYFRGIEEDEIKDTLRFISSAKMFDFQESDTRFLVFNPSLKIILIIRLIELQEGDSKLLKKEVDHCINEVNILCFLLRDELENTGVIVTGLVTYAGENAHSQSVCKDCDNIFSFEIFNSVKTFKGFLKSFFREKKINDLKIQVARDLKKNKVNVFQAVASKILGYLSHFQFKMLQEPVLPVAEQDATDNIKQAELLLNCYQMEIAYSNDNRIWLEGNYGTGKTIVALKKLELLLKALKAKEVIYYVSFARSLLYLKIKQIFEKYENVRAIRGEYSLSNTIKHQILPKEKKIGTKNIHLIVDEYSSQDLSTKEVESLIPILNEKEELKNSTVFIAVQPIKINRVEKICENGIKREFSETKHELKKLVKATGIKVRTLKNVMRTTVQINNLVEITREYLHEQSNRCVHHAVRSDFKEVTNFNSSFQSRTPESNVSLSVTSDYSSNRTTSSLSSPPEELIDYDEIYKLVHTEINADEENFRETVTSYSYTCDGSQIGHDINGPLPQFIKFSESADLYEQVAVIALVLDKIIEPEETKPNRIAVIHFEPDDPPLWLKSLFQLENISPKLKVTNNTEKFLKNDNKNLVLVKNLKFLRGLEFSKVLLILDSDEHHMRHLIPEAIARCMSNLAVLIRPPVHGIHKPNTVADLADEWEKHLDSGILGILKIGFCLEPSCNEKKVQLETYCEGKIMFGTSYGVHKNSKSYKNFYREIKRKKIGNVQPEYKDKQRKAEALLDADFQDKKSKARLDINPQLVKRFIDAARSDNVSEVGDMVRRGVPIDVTDEDGYTALYWAAYTNHIDVVEELLKFGANVNIQNRYHWTPLHAAAQVNNTDIMQVLLLRGGANPSITNNKRQTALDVAREFNRQEAVRLLERY